MDMGTGKDMDMGMGMGMEETMVIMKKNPKKIKRD